MDYKNGPKVNPLRRMAGVDQLRYVFALWVFFTHGGAPPLFAGHAATSLWENVEKVYGWSINGQAAVMGFFIISGLCIHYPNIQRDKLELKSFFAARLLRLTLPLLACLLLGWILKFTHPDGFLRVVPIWTLYCEAFYYCIYPIVFLIRKKGFLTHFTILTALISLILLIIWSDDRNMYFHEIGGKGDGGFLAWRAALIGFPVWLLGCLVGERMYNGAIIDRAVTSKIPIWGWRAGAVLLSAVVFPLFRLGLYLNLIKLPFIGLFFSSQFTLLLFSVYCFFWIEREIIIANYGTNLPNRYLEFLGLSSFSLYLVHTLLIWLFHKIEPNLFPGYLFAWLILLALLHIFTLLFYYLVEKPAHKISKVISSALRSK